MAFKDSCGLFGVGVELWEDTSPKVSLQSVSCSTSKDLLWELRGEVSLSTSKVVPWGIFCSTSKVVLLGIRGNISWLTQELLDSWIDGAILGGRVKSTLLTPASLDSVSYLPESVECGA